MHCACFRELLKRIVRLVFVAAIITEALSACAIPAEQREERAKAALEKKYGREFEITEVYPQRFSKNYYEVQAYEIHEPNIRFFASVNTQDDGESDDYVTVRVCAAISAQSEENLDMTPGIYFVHTYAPGPQPHCEDPDISIRDFAALDPLNVFRIEVYLIPDEDASPQELYNGLSALLKEMESLPTSVWLRLVNEDQFRMAQELLTEVEPMSMEYQAFKEGLHNVALTFRQGTMQTTLSEFTAAIRSGA